MRSSVRSSLLQRPIHVKRTIHLLIRPDRSHANNTTDELGLTGRISRSILNQSGTESLQESGLRKRQRATDSEAVARLKSTHGRIREWTWGPRFVRFDTAAQLNLQQTLTKTRAQPNTYSEEISARATPLLQVAQLCDRKKDSKLLRGFLFKIEHPVTQRHEQPNLLF